MKPIYRLVWIGLFLAIMAVGVPMLGKPDSAMPLKDFGPDGSVNAVFEQTLKETKVSERLGAWLGELPRAQAILLLAPPDHLPAAITADLVSYLAWPRPVIISRDEEKSIRLLANARGRYCAVGFCFLQPPQGAKISQSFGPRLTFISTETESK